MKRQLARILVGLVFTCLSGWSQGSDWDEFMSAGKAAMDRHQYAVAEKSFREALAAAGHFEHGEEDARFSATLLFLAQACDAQSKRDEAETFAGRAGDAMDKSLKAYKPAKTEDQLYESDVASALFDKVGDIFAGHQKYADAERLYQRVIKIRAAWADDSHGIGGNEEFYRFWLQVEQDAKTKLAAARQKLGKLYFSEHKYPQAITQYEEATRILENDSGDKRLLAETLTNLASCHAVQGEYVAAEPLYQRALKFFEQAGWMDKPETISTMQLYALLLKKTGREAEATAMLQKAAAIREKLGAHAP